MKKLTLIFALLVSTLMFSSPSYAEKKYVCDGWILGDKSGSKEYKFGLKIERDRNLLIENLKRPEISMEWNLIHKEERSLISMYASKKRWVEYITVIRNKDTNSVELHKWNINSHPSSETSDVRKNFGVNHRSHLSFTKCYSF